MTKIDFLKYLSKGWFGNSQQHAIHAQLLKARGLNKLADKIMAESDEEWDEAKKVNARLTDLAAAYRDLAAARAKPKATEEEKAERAFDIEFCKKRIAAKKAFDKFYGDKTLFEEPSMEELTALFDREDAIDAQIFDAVQAQNAAQKAKQQTQVAMQKETARRLQAEKKQVQKDQKALMDAFARFNRAAKPYNDARRLLRQRENYSRFDEIAALYETAKANTKQEETTE